MEEKVKDHPGFGLSWGPAVFLSVSARLRYIPERMSRIVVTGEVDIMNSVINTS
jgi:hypothetical protein